MLNCRVYAVYCYYKIQTIPIDKLRVLQIYIHLKIYMMSLDISVDVSIYILVYSDSVDISVGCEYIHISV